MQKLKGSVANINPSVAELSDIQMLIKDARKIGVKHGDIHIDNIMFNEVNGVKKFYLIDFGMATKHNKNDFNHTNTVRGLNIANNAKRKQAKAPRRRFALTNNSNNNSNKTRTVPKSLF